AMRHEAAEHQRISRRKMNRRARKSREIFIAQDVKISVALRQAAATVRTRIELNTSVFIVGPVNGDYHGGKTLGKCRPGDKVLMQGIAARPRELIDELIFDRVNGLTDQLLEHRGDPEVIEPATTVRRDVGHRIEHLKDRLLGLQVNLPTHAQVLLLLQ